MMAERRRLSSSSGSSSSSLEPSKPSSSSSLKKSKLSESDKDIVLKEKEEGGLVDAAAEEEEEEEAEISLETNEILSRSSSLETEDNNSSSKENLEIDNPPLIPGTSKGGSGGGGGGGNNNNSSRKTTNDSLVIVVSGGDDGEQQQQQHAHYQELSQIGDGAYGTVYKAKDLSSGQVVALKKVRVPLTEDGLPMSTLREIAGLKQLERYEHPNIVKLLDVCQGNYLQLPPSSSTQSTATTIEQTPESLNRGLILWLVFEHVEQDLASFISISPPGGLSRQLIKQMSKEILEGVDFLHTHRIIHRDLKPQNLLVTREGRIKIADFGLAKTYDFEMRLTSVVVTLWYRAPEVLLGCPYATPVDIWSVGCILAELNRLAPLFPGTSEGDELDRIFQVIGTPSQEEWPKNVSLSWTAFPQRRPMSLRNIIPEINNDGLDLITNLLTFKPHDRLTARQALQHKYFDDGSS